MPYNSDYNAPPSSSSTTTAPTTPEPETPKSPLDDPPSSSSTSSSSSCSSECECPMADDGGGDNVSNPASDGEGSGDGGGGGPTSSSTSSSSSSTCPSYSQNPIRYSNGEIRQVGGNLRMQGYGQRWGHTVSYGTRLNANYDGPNGHRWFIRELPQLGKDGSGNISVQGVINDAIWFNKSGVNYVARFFSRETLAEAGTGASNEFTFTDTHGQVLKFFGFDVAIPAAKQGQFKSLTDPYGHNWTPTYNASNQVTDFIMGTSPTLGYYYTYYTSGTANGKLQYVTLKRGTTNLRRIEYQYHPGGDGNGATNDLMLAIEQQWNGSTWVTLGSTYRRYYDADGVDGFTHGLKFALKPEGYARMVAAGQDPLTASDAVLAAYADQKFKFNNSTDKRVSEETVNAHGTTSSSTTAAFAYAYTSSANPVDANQWKTKNVETLPAIGGGSGNQQIVYSNGLGQAMLKVVKRVSDSAEWREWTQYDSAGRVTQRAEGSAISSYSEASPGLVTLAASAGLIRVFEYYATTDLPNGAVVGMLQYEKIKQGSSGATTTVKEFKYTSQTAGGKTVYPVWKEIFYLSDTGGGSSPVEKVYAYTWFTGTVQMEQRTTTWPAVTAAQNGSAVADARVERFDEWGNLIWIKDERGFITRLKYDLATGAVNQRIDDVNTSLVTDEPAGWVTPAGGGLHLITDYVIDNLGRTTKESGPLHDISLSGTSTPLRRTTWTVFNDPGEVRQAVGYETSSTTSVTVLTEPITVTKFDRSGRVTDIIATKRDPVVSGALTPTENVTTQARWVRWRKFVYGTNERRPDGERAYFAIPTTDGDQGNATDNYSETLYGYDLLGRRTRIKSPGGTITRFVYHVKGWLLERWVGTDDTGATDANPAGAGAPNNMVKVAAYEYDGNVDKKEGLLTKKTLQVDAANTRVTNYLYDFRLRRTRLTGELNSREDYTYDNQGRLTRLDTINNASAILVGRQETNYDNLGRVFRTLRYAVNVTTGAVGNSLKDDFWYDATGFLMKRKSPGSSALEKFSYDGIGRMTRRYVTTNPADDTYAEAGSITTDTVFVQEEYTYDAASNVTQQLTRRRFHDATGAGALTTPGGAQPKARVSYLAFWPDALGREQARADYGTNAAAAFSRPANPPARSDTVLVTSTLYNQAGEAYETTDPAGRKLRLTFDQAGRLTSRIEDYGTTPALNRETTFTYNLDGRLRYLTAKNTVTGDQITKFVYGTTLTDSDIASNDLLRGQIYPDSTDPDNPLSGTDHVEMKYNRLGEVREVKDQLGTIHTLSYDKLGRLTDDDVTTFGTGVDQTIKKISRTYEVRGMLDKITSRNAVPTVINEVQLSYNDFGLPTQEAQEHAGAVSGSSLKVQYAYTDGSANHTRLTTLTYPDARTTTFDFGAAGSAEDLLSRAAALKQSATVLVGYSYLGRNDIVIAGYSGQPGVELTYFTSGGSGDAGDQYTGLDRFGRVIDQRWRKTSDNTDRERVKYGFDRVSNRIWRQNTVAGTGQDEFYTYDTLNQIKTLKRGTLTGTPPTGIAGTPSWEEQFTYDPTGNWNGATTGYKTLVSGSTTLDQNRTHNKANEILTITGTPNWIDPTHNAVGNMTVMPQPGTPTSSYDAKYDAWNRLVEVKVTGGSVVGAYVYDGLNRRVRKTTPSPTRDYYYTRQWQVIEERVSGGVDRQFVWGQRYADDLIIRDRGAERFYVLHDYFHPTGVLSTAAVVQERYGYDAFGAGRVMDGAFSLRSASLYDWETRYGAYRLDLEAGLYHVRNRYYAVGIGRWLSRDPLHNDRSMDLYWYVRNRPISRVDPFGLEEKEEEKLESQWPTAEETIAIKLCKIPIIRVIACKIAYDTCVAKCEKYADDDCHKLLEPCLDDCHKNWVKCTVKKTFKQPKPPKSPGDKPEKPPKEKKP